MLLSVSIDNMSFNIYVVINERKPHLHNATVMVDTDKYRLVGIPPSGRQP